MSYLFLCKLRKFTFHNRDYILNLYNSIIKQRDKTNMIYFYSYANKTTSCMTEQEFLQNYLENKNVRQQYLVNLSDIVSNSLFDNIDIDFDYHTIVYSQNPQDIYDLFDYEISLLEPDVSFDDFDQQQHLWNQQEKLMNLVKKVNNSK